MKILAFMKRMDNFCLVLGYMVCYGTQVENPTFKGSIGAFFSIVIFAGMTTFLAHILTRIKLYGFKTCMKTGFKSEKYKRKDGTTRETETL